MIDPLVLIGSVVTTGGAWWWVKSHSHPEYMERQEFDLLRQLLQVQHAALEQRLERIEAALDRRRPVE